MVNRRLYHSFVKRNGSGKLANISFVVKNGMFNRRLFMALLKVTYFWSNPGVPSRIHLFDPNLFYVLLLEPV